VAPSSRECLRAAAVLGGEEGDDGAEDGVGKAADQVTGVTSSSPFPSGSMGFSLLRSRSGCGRRRRGLALRLLHGRWVARREMCPWPSPAARGNQ
jgi:hypothetical protein